MRARHGLRHKCHFPTLLEALAWARNGDEEALTEEALAEFLMLPADLSALLLRTKVSGVTVEIRSPMRCCCRCQPSCCVECVGTEYVAAACGATSAELT